MEKWPKKEEQKKPFLSAAARVESGVIRFGAEGYHVVANDLESQSDLLDDLTSEIVSAGGKCTALFADVSDDSSVAVMVAQAIKETGKIDVLVNNAGILSTNLIRHSPSKRLLFDFAVVCAPVKPFFDAVAWFGRLSRELSAIFGLSGWFDADLV